MASKSLIDTLMGVMSKVGIRMHQLPTDNEFISLTQHLIQHYGTHTQEEVKLAFDLAITGQLDLEASQIPCYANFSPLYLSTVMNSYRRWVTARRKTLLPDPVPVPQLMYREDTTDTGMQEWFNQVILSVVNEDRDPELLPVQVFDWLIKSGRLKMTEQEMNDFQVKAVWRREELLKYFSERDGATALIRLSNFVKMRYNGTFFGNEVHIIVDLAKRIALKEHILKNSQTNKNQQDGQTD